MATKKQIKDLKKEIIKESAVNVGYNKSVVQQLPTDAMLKAIRTISLGGWVNVDTPDANLENIFITEAVKEMSYQEFKDIAPYFFSSIFNKD